MARRAASSAPAEQPAEREEAMKRIKPELTDEQEVQLDRLADLADDQIDTSDIPETLDWSRGIGGMFFRPVRQEVTIQIRWTNT